MDLASGASVSIFLDVLKNFINFREFSYACEKAICFCPCFKRLFLKINIIN